MYSESDIEAAVASGALSAEAAAALRDSVARGRQSSLVDEESFRLITGFNDIFVSIAAILMLVAVGWIGSAIGTALTPMPPGGADAWTRGFAGSGFVSGAFVAATSWLLAEYFTRARRMALPSILLLVTFAGGTFGALLALVQLASPNLFADSASTRAGAAAVALVAALTAGSAWLHWRRFHVPVTIAVLTGAAVLTLLSLVFTVVPETRAAWLWVLLAAGIGVFAFAMWWDMSDRARVTRRSDVAFWLHLAAAPMIAHPVFWLLGVTSGIVTTGTALAVILLYILFGLVALAVDRRALLVSSLFYVLYALQALFQAFGAVSLNVALTALLIGSALLLLSAFWHPIRRMVVSRLSPGLRARLPELDRPMPAAARL